MDAPGRRRPLPYAAEWTGTKLRWNLTHDVTEHATSNDLAAACPDQTVTYTPAD